MSVTAMSVTVTAMSVTVIVMLVAVVATGIVDIITEHEYGMYRQRGWGYVPFT